MFSGPPLALCSAALRSTGPRYVPTDRGTEPGQASAQAAAARASVPASLSGRGLTPFAEGPTRSWALQCREDLAAVHACVC